MCTLASWLLICMGWALQVSWDDIAGQETAKRLVQELVVWPMLNPHLFKVCGGTRMDNLHPAELSQSGSKQQWTHNGWSASS